MSQSNADALNGTRNVTGTKLFLLHFTSGSFSSHGRTRQGLPSYPRSQSPGHGFEIIGEEPEEDKDPSEWVEFSKQAAEEQVEVQAQVPAESAVGQQKEHTIPDATHQDAQLEKMRRANARLELRVQVCTPAPTPLLW